MVNVHIRKDSRDRLSSFSATGHAGWAEDGEDVVCAAVSTTLQAAWLGLSEISKIDVRGSRQNGRMEFSWPPETRDDPGVRAIVATVALSVERLAMQYPDYIGVIHERHDGVIVPHGSERGNTMTDIFKPINDDRTSTSNSSPDSYGNSTPSSDAGRALLAGLVGGVVSAAGYLVYQRLPDDQKVKLQAQVRALVESRVNELRSRFNL